MPTQRALTSVCMCFVLLDRREELANWLPDEVTFKPKVNTSPQVMGKSVCACMCVLSVCVRACVF